MNQWQSHFPLSQIITHILAGLLTITLIIQDIISNLKSQPKMLAIGSHCIADQCIAVDATTFLGRQHGTNTTRGFK